MRPTTTLTDRTRRGTDSLALIAFCGFLFLLGLQLVGLIGVDEPRYAQVAREMLARHDWVTPVLYGVPWLEKPPLYYWLAMLSYKGAGGVSDTAARLPVAVLSSLLIIFIYGWSRRFRTGMQLDAALITCSAAAVIGFGRSASTDMPLTVMFTVAMLSWYGWYASQRRSWLLSFYFFSGLATLAKGPIAVLLPGTIIIVFLMLRRDGRLLLRTLWPIGIAVYLAVVAPWFIAVQHANPQFFRVFFLQHNLERFSSNLYHHPQPFWFYLPVVLLALVPWTVFIVTAVVDALRDWRFATQQPPAQEDLRTYLAIWFLIPILFFSLSHSKLPGYILPAIPAGTILLADFILRRDQESAKPARWLVLLHSLLSSAMLIAAFIVPFKLLHLALPKTVILVAAALAVVTTLMYLADPGEPGLSRAALHDAGTGGDRLRADSARHCPDHQHPAIRAAGASIARVDRNRPRSHHRGLRCSGQRGIRTGFLPQSPCGQLRESRDSCGRSHRHCRQRHAEGTSIPASRTQGRFVWRLFVAASRLLSGCGNQSRYDPIKLRLQETKQTPHSSLSGALLFRQ